MTGLEILQLGIDTGRILALSVHTKTTDDLREAAKNIIEALGLPPTINEEPMFLLGLGWGLGDRQRTPVEEATKGIVGVN